MKVHIQYSAGKPISVEFKCPGCGGSHHLPVRDEAEEKHPSWTFNGSGTYPTLAPSILSKIGPIPMPEHRVNQSGWNADGMKICHSYVTNGRIQFLDDSTHSLAGQTVDLPEYP